MAMYGWLLMIVCLSCSVWNSNGQLRPGQDCGYWSHPKCTISDIKSNWELKSHMMQLNYAGKTILVLNRITIPEGLEGRVFDYTQFSSLIFNNFDIGGINMTKENPFSGYNYIRKLYFLNSTEIIQHWESSATHLASLKLTDLVFSGGPDKAFNSYNYLPAWFSEMGSSTIRYLEISAFCLSQLNTGSMASFTNVEKISLVGNTISSIKPNAFPATSTLKVIDLKANCIKVVGEKLFPLAGLTGLEEVYLQHNALANINQNGIPQTIKKFYINDNHGLKCTKNIIWLLSVNRFEWEDSKGRHATCFEPDGLTGCPLVNLDAEDIKSGNKPPGLNCEAPIIGTYCPM